MLARATGTPTITGQDHSWGGQLAVEEIMRNGHQVLRPVWRLSGLRDDQPSAGEYSIYYFAAPTTFTEVASRDGRLTLYIDANAPCFAAGTWLLIASGYEAPPDLDHHRTLGTTYFVAAAHANQDSEAYQVQGTFKMRFNTLGLPLSPAQTPDICVAGHGNGFIWTGASDEDPQRLPGNVAVEVAGVSQLGFFAVMVDV